MTDTAGAAGTLDSETVRRLCGDILDETVIAILETGASVADLETALTWRDGRDDDTAEEHPLSGAAQAVYDLLTADEEAIEER